MENVACGSLWGGGLASLWGAGLCLALDLLSLLVCILQAAAGLAIVPAKENWDLKRGVEERLERLERETQRAIGEMVRERLEKGDSGEEFAGDALARAVEMHTGGTVEEK